MAAVAQQDIVQRLQAMMNVNARHAAQTAVQKPVFPAQDADRAVILIAQPPGGQADHAYVPFVPGNDQSRFFQKIMIEGRLLRLTHQTALGTLAPVVEGVQLRRQTFRLREGSRHHQPHALARIVQPPGGVQPGPQLEPQRVRGHSAAAGAHA